MKPKQKYHPSAAKAQSWNYIENRYIIDWGNKHKRLIELVQHIKNSGLSQRLFGSTSMDKLVVSIYDPIDYRKESLHITFDLKSEQWLFRYFAQPYQDPEFVRKYEADKGVEKFDQFIHWLKW